MVQQITRDVESIPLEQAAAAEDTNKILAAIGGVQTSTDAHKSSLSTELQSAFSTVGSKVGSAQANLETASGRQRVCRLQQRPSGNQTKGLKYRGRTPDHEAGHRQGRRSSRCR